MRINGSPERGEIEQFQAHGQYDPCNNQARPGRPRLLESLVAAHAECTPHDVLYHSSCNIGSHVVRIIPAPHAQIRDVRHVQHDARQGPEAEQRLLDRGPLLVKTENADGGVVETIQHARSGAKVVQLLGQVEVAGVEDHAEDPDCKSHIAEQDIVFSQRVFRWDAIPDLGQAILVCQEVEERKQDGKGLLYAEEAVKRPFPVILHDWLEHGRVSGDTTVGDDVLAYIVTIGRASPEEQAEVESWSIACQRSCRVKEVLGDLRIAALCPLQFSSTQT